jgi:hypothetical protein
MIRDHHTGFFIFAGGKIFFMEQAGAVICGFFLLNSDCILEKVKGFKQQ